MNDHDEISELERLISQSIQSPSSSAMTPLYSYGSREASLRLQAQSSMRSARSLKDLQARDILVQALKDRIEVLERECDLSNEMAHRSDDRCQQLVAKQQCINEENQILTNKLAIAMKHAENRESELEEERVRYD
jgi:hypothetical protein